MMFPTIEAQTQLQTPPTWAVLERELIDKINDAAPQVLEKYTRADGTLLWPTTPDFQSIDGLDDAYESFHNWPLFYMLGGDTQFLVDADTEFDVITNDMTRYGSGHGYPMVVKDYQPGYDWFHQGEGNYLFYMLCMADPLNAKHIERAKRFAGFFMNEDPEAPNYDSQHKIIKCAMNGSKGPAFWAFAGHPYWPWDGYNMPFYDIPGGTSHEAVRENEVLRTRMGQRIRERQGVGDTVVNLAATTLATNAYLLTGENKYSEWVREYVDAWIERTAENGGIVPDNVGLTGKIGEHIDGKWYGSYYGWSWPHGWHSVGQAVSIAGQNAALLWRDLGFLDFPRSQIDVLIQQGIEKDDQLYVPQKYGDPGRVNYVPGAWLQYPITNEDGTALQVDGWFEFMPMHPSDVAHLWAMSMDDADQDRAEQIAKKTGSKFDINAWHHTKDSGGRDGGWLAYMRGDYPEYPEAILNHNLSQVEQRLTYMENDEEDPAGYGDAYFQRRNPVTCEGLVQLTCGGPLPHYNGGLFVTRVRHFDPQEKRPGLPSDVSALVTKLTADTTELQLVNLNKTASREVIVQAGAMGEHNFTSARVNAGEAVQTVPVNGMYICVQLPPNTEIDLELGMERFVNAPSYRHPW
ncbi:hypothetical protein F4054_22650 [Candidatus Poribacteria bacterium]|nr:hypothetical protein [Candidatus Poribacteria bacterium]MYG08196.1 hypothetical protein [Candidatus Poribacteria bacterium]MYK25052.1 hypothetical protein [Candidatus Poribacteria bacterium]